MKVLCLGDSLTKGYANNILDNNYLIYNKGKDGDTVLDIYNRLISLLEEDNYDIVILLGGTNDLGSIVCKSEKYEIFNEVIDNFKNIYNIIDNNDNIIKFFHLTIPFNALDNFENEKNNKIELNDFIKNNLYSNKRTIIDINTEFNYLLLNEEDRELYWDDSIHYSDIGYNLLSKYIYKKITN